MKTSEINNLKNQLNPEKQKTIYDLYKLVANDEISPITDESDNIIGFNFHKGITGIKFSKVINHRHPTYGATEEERQEDEKRLRQFIEDFEKPFGTNFIEKVVNFSYQLVAANVKPDDILYNEGLFFYFVLTDKKVYNQFGEVVVDCSDIKENLSDETLMRLLKSEFYASL